MVYRVKMEDVMFNRYVLTLAIVALVGSGLYAGKEQQKKQSGSYKKEYRNKGAQKRDARSKEKQPDAPKTEQLSQVDKDLDARMLTDARACFEDWKRMDPESRQAQDKHGACWGCYMHYCRNNRRHLDPMSCLSAKCPDEEDEGSNA